MVTLISCIIGDGLTSEPCYVSRWKGCLNKKYSTGESVGNGGSKIEPRKFFFLVFFFQIMLWRTDFPLVSFVLNLSKNDHGPRAMSLNTSRWEKNPNQNFNCACVQKRTTKKLREERMKSHFY